MTQQLVSPRLSDLRKERKPKQKMAFFMWPLGNAKLSVLPWSLASQAIPVRQGGAYTVCELGGAGGRAGHCGGL